MNILIIGSGGREHALAWKIKQSPLCNQLYVAPGNGGTAQIATNISLGVNDFSEIKDLIQKNEIDMVVVGPEDPLVNGIVDELQNIKGLLVIGPDQAGAQLEGSKDFAKRFMKKYSIPTAASEIFDVFTQDRGLEYLEKINGPYVLKADGLAAGKGVIITPDLEEAKEALKKLLGGQFGQASRHVLVEDFLDGIELSVFVLTDGNSYCILPEAKDYKRIGENDSGPNTGGMGAVSPVPFADEAFMKKIEDKIIRPTVEGIKKEGFDYKGFIFFGLIKVDDEPLVIEYNVRMGDPETEVVMPRISSDLVPALIATATGELKGNEIEISDETATTVMMVSEGYPGYYEKGRAMEVTTDLGTAIPFHAGTKIEEDSLLTNGGRVIALTGLGKTMKEALENSYGAVEKVKWQGANYRTDIGFDL